MTGIPIDSMPPSTATAQASSVQASSVQASSVQGASMSAPAGHGQQKGSKKTLIGTGQAVGTQNDASESALVTADTGVRNKHSLRVVPNLRRFIATLRGVGLAAELSDVLLDKLRVGITEAATPAAALSSRLDLLDRYYGGFDDKQASSRRARMDRFFICKQGAPSSAATLLADLNGLLPELEGLEIERVGSGEGPLVVRSGDHAGIVDDVTAGHASDEETASISAIVAAVNVVLSHHNIRDRFLELRSDGKREAYFAAGVTEAVQLCNDGFLEDGNVDDVMAFGAW